MQYMGSKARIAKHLLPVMLKDRIEGQAWVEPFVGGANMISTVSGHRIGADINEYLIALLVAVRDGWVPPTEVSREMYHEVKGNPDKHPKHMYGFVGFLCSFGGKWWGGYAHNNNGDNYAARGSRCMVKQSSSIKGVEFNVSAYESMIIPDRSIVYCDPPYRGTTAYRDKFDHDKFFDWCRNMSMSGHTVFVSEYKAPDDFLCVKEVYHKTILDKNSQYARTEKLFIAPK